MGPLVHLMAVLRSITSSAVMKMQKPDVIELWTCGCTYVASSRASTASTRSRPESSPSSAPWLASAGSAMAIQALEMGGAKPAGAGRWCWHEQQLGTGARKLRLSGKLSRLQHRGPARCYATGSKASTSRIKKQLLRLTKENNCKMCIFSTTIFLSQGGLWKRHAGLCNQKRVETGGSCPLIFTLIIASRA